VRGTHACVQGKVPYLTHLTPISHNHPYICLCMTRSLSPTFYGPVGLSEEQCIAVLHEAYRLGVRLFNTRHVGMQTGAPEHHLEPCVKWARKHRR
jgi:hypothetical protein